MNFLSNVAWSSLFSPRSQNVVRNSVEKKTKTEEHDNFVKIKINGVLKIASLRK